MNKHIFSFIAATLLSSGTANATLIAHYEFDGDATDAVGGTAADGVNNGASNTSDRFGMANGAFFFNGSANVSLSTVFGADQTIMSVSAWFMRSADNGTWNDLLAGSCGGPIFGLDPTDTITFGNQCENSIPHNQSSGVVLDTSIWHHAVGTYDGATLNVFLDNMILPTNSGHIVKRHFLPQKLLG